MDITVVVFTSTPGLCNAEYTIRMYTISMYTIRSPK